MATMRNASNPSLRVITKAWSIGRIPTGETETQSQDEEASLLRHIRPVKSDSGARIVRAPYVKLKHMPRPSSLAIAFAVAACVCVAAQQPPATFRAGTQVVSLFVTVADAEKRLVPDLTQADFEVYDNEKLQTITLFDNSVRPITVVIMLDTSGSMTLTIDLLKQAAEQFILRLLPDDRARVGAFNDKIQFSSKFTNNRDELAGDVKDLDYGNGTRLWDAVNASLDELKGIDGRKVILLFTDGDDTQSR